MLKKINQKIDYFPYWVRSKFSLFIKFLSFIEISLFGKKNNIVNEHVYIVGMPRSGSTFLTEMLYNTNNYFCFTYSEFPFFELPNFWSYFKNLYFLFNKKKRMRLHNDGVYIDLKSIDSFDEIILDRIINKKNKSQINLNQFNEYMGIINHCTTYNNKKKYLAKNFHMVFKLDKLLNLNSNAKFIVTFRNPINHVFSLLRQHTNFLKLEEIEYKLKQKMMIMNHFEFGPSRFFFSFENLNFKFKFKLDSDIYLSYWIYIYEYLYSNYRNNKRVIFINYDNLTNKSNDSVLYNELKKISNFINYDIDVSKSTFFSKKQNIIHANKKLLLKSQELYEKISKL